MQNQHLSNKQTQVVWQQVCSDLKPQLSTIAFNTWIISNPLVELNSLDENQLEAVILAQSAFHLTNLKRTACSYLKNSLEKITGKKIELQFKISSFPTQTTKQKKRRVGARVKTRYPASPSSAVDSNSPSSTTAGFATPASMQIIEAPFQRRVNSDQKKPDFINDDQTNKQANLAAHNNLNQPNNFFPNKTGQSPTVEELFSTQTIAMSVQDRALVSARRVGLRLNYTFASFAVSSSNEMAHAAAIAVSKQLGSAYNPLFLYGSVGVGKTHLMHAIGHNVLKNNPDVNLIYCTGEEFTNQIVRAIQNKKAIRFKQKYRNAQVLFVDDIQFIAGKNTIQEEFFHTFNALVQKGSQIVLTSDRPPQEITLLENRLKSRFEAGLMIDIQQPSIELRTAIVLIKSRSNKIILPMELAQLIAEQIKSARRIEGIITQIRSEIELKKRPISRSLIEEVLAKENRKRDKTKILRIRPADLIKKVAVFYQIQPTIIKGKKRAKEIVFARHIAMYLLKQDVQLSYVEIGKWFSNRDHTSVMHAVKKIEKLINGEDLVVSEDVEKIRKRLS